MNLLKKPLANLEAERQKREQIDQGVAIAQKIDVLRKTLADLETQHSTFIAGLRVDLEQKTKEQFEKLANLQFEIKRTEDYKNGLKVPEIEDLITSLKKKEQSAIIYEKTLKEQIQKTKVRERELTRLINKK